MDVDDQKSSFITRLKAMFTVRNIAWFMGFSLVVGSVIYFTGQGGTYKSFFTPPPLPTPSEMVSESAITGMVEEVQQVATGNGEPSCADLTSELDQIETNFKNATTSEEMESFENQFKIKASQLSLTAGCENLFETTYKSKASEMVNQIEAKKKTETIQIAMGVVTPITEFPIITVTPPITITPTCVQYKTTLKNNYGTITQPTVSYTALTTAIKEFMATYDKYSTECKTDDEIEGWKSIVLAKATGIEECIKTKNALSSLHTKILSYTDPKSKAFYADVESFTSAYKELSANKCDFGKETNEIIEKWRTEVGAKVNEFKPPLLSPECQTQKTDLENKYKAVQSASLETLKPVAKDFVVAYKSYLEACPQDESNVKSWLDGVTTILQEKIVAPCASTLKMLNESYKTLKLEQYLTKEVINLFESKWDSFFTQCPDFKTDDIKQAHDAMLSMLEAKIKKEPVIVTEIKCPTDTASILASYKLNYNQANTDTKKVDWGYKFTNLVDQAIAQGCPVSEDFKITATAIKKEIDALLAEMTAVPPAKISPLVVFKEPQKEPPAEEQIIEKFGKKLPAWGAEGEWEIEQPEVTIEETPKTVQIEKAQPEQKSYLAQETATVKKAKRPSAAKRVKETAGTGPGILFYPLVAAISYGAARIIRKNKK